MNIPVPVLETSRLILKPMSLEFAADYERYFVNFEVIRHLSAGVPWPYPRGGVVQFLEKVILPGQGTDRWTWGLFLKERPTELIGCVDFWRKGQPENRGFWLANHLWGQGLMTEAVEPVNEFAFNKLALQKIVFSNALGNLRSRRIKEKTGAQFTGNRPAKFVDPAVTEAETWELTKEAWEAFRLSRT